MFRRPVNCAVLVDFDNVVQIVGAPFGENAQAWLNWFEDARFDPGGRRRRLVRKMVYWNEHNERKWRPYFEAVGFEAFNCPSLVKSKKSEADMRIALDAQRLAYEAKEIEEFAIISTDTDFVPLLNCLAALDRRTIAAANPDNASYVVYRKYADIAVSVEALREACAYQRPPPFWRRWLSGLRAERLDPPLPPPGGRNRLAVEGGPGASATTRLKRLGLWRRGEASAKQTAAEKGTPELEQAADIIVDIARDAPGLPVARRTLERRLAEEMPEFRTRGPRAYLGCGEYHNLLRVVGALRANLRVHFYGNGGAAISYRDDE